jgi:hypothetical protein
MLRWINQASGLLIASFGGWALLTAVIEVLSFKF